MKVPRLATWGMVLGLSVVVTAVASAQDDRSTGRRPDAPRAAARADDDPALLARLKRRFDEIQRFESTLEEAIEHLEGGGSSADLPRDLGWALGWRMRRGDTDRPPTGAGNRGTPDRDTGPRHGGEDGPTPPTPGDDRGRWRDRPDDAHQQTVSREQLAKMVEEHFPKIHERLSEADPGMRDRVMGHLAPRLGEIAELREESPGLFRAKITEMQAGFDLMESHRALAHAVAQRESDPDGYDRTVERVRRVVDSYLDAHAQVREQELQRLLDQIDELRADIERDTANRDEAVEERVQQLIESAGRRGRRGGPDAGRGRGPTDRPRRQDRGG